MNTSKALPLAAVALVLLLVGTFFALRETSPVREGTPAPTKGSPSEADTQRSQEDLRSASVPAAGVDPGETGTSRVNDSQPSSQVAPSSAEPQGSGSLLATERNVGEQDPTAPFFSSWQTDHGASPAPPGDLSNANRVHKRLVTEPRDAQWAGTMEQAIQDYFSRQPTSNLYSDFAVRCGSTVCEMTAIARESQLQGVTQDWNAIVEGFQHESFAKELVWPSVGVMSNAMFPGLIGFYSFVERNRRGSS